MFLGRTVKAPQVRCVDRTSTSKVVRVFLIRHRDEVEAPPSPTGFRKRTELFDVLAATASAKTTAVRRGLTRRRKVDPTRAISTSNPGPKKSNAKAAEDRRRQEGKAGA